MTDEIQTHIEPVVTQIADQGVSVTTQAPPVVDPNAIPLEEMRIASITESTVTFESGRSLPIVGFVDAEHKPTSYELARTAIAGDGSIFIAL